MSESVLREVLEVGIPFVLRALTPLHPGSGSRISGIAELPIQREAGTDMPVIYGSSLKGALRSWAMVKGIERIEEIFGPPPGRGDEGMGKAIFMEAKILFLPVRSYKGIYGWVTSPFLLKRFERDLRIVRELSGSGESVEINVEVEREAIGAEENELKFELGGKKVVVLEDHILDFKEEGMDFISLFGALSEELRKRLVVVHDETFKRLMSRAMEIVPHIEVSKETGTVKNLWFQENLPSETMLYSVIFAPRELEGEIRKLLSGVIHVGGDITTGLGFTEVYLI